MQTVISGICVGFRIIKGTGKDASDYGKLHVLQMGTNKLDPDLVPIYINDIINLEYLLNHYSNGALRWINAICHTEMDGREKIWVLAQILHLDENRLQIEGASA